MIFQHKHSNMGTIIPDAFQIVQNFCVSYRHFRRAGAFLVSYVENGQLSTEGIERLCQAVESLGRLFAALPCEKTFYFATSALRSLQNGDAVLQQVKLRTGVDIQVISGQEEAYYDYVSLKHSTTLVAALQSLFFSTSVTKDTICSTSVKELPISSKADSENVPFLSEG